MLTNRFAAALMLAAGLLAAAAKSGVPELFAKSNLVAWCIVPFDAKKRGPEERAEMMHRLGITRFVYDWRDKDIPDWDREMDALAKRGIKLHGFWTPYPVDAAKPSKLPQIVELLARRKIRTELWLSLGLDKSFDALPDDQKVEAAAAAVTRVAREAKAIGAKVGLYNHGGWFGEPENQIEVIKRVKMPNVGIVYNFHHGHDHISRFPQMLAKMQRYLLAININGMKMGTKILPVGEGDQELAMLRAVVASGYRGPIGILGHREDLDAELALSLNLKGLEKLLPALRKD